MNDQLFRIVNAWCARNYPGYAPRQLSIQFAQDAPPARLPIPAGTGRRAYDIDKPRRLRSRDDRRERERDLTPPRRRRDERREPEPEPQPERKKKRKRPDQREPEVRSKEPSRHEPESPVTKKAPTQRIWHSDDFSSVVWDGVPYGFTPTQAAAVRELWDRWTNGAPDYPQKQLLCDIGSTRDTDGDARLRDIFRVKGRDHKAWGNMIRPGKTRGTYRLFSTDSDMPVEPEDD